MAGSTAFDLLKALATDNSFRSQLNNSGMQEKRDLLQRYGFAGITASDLRTATSAFSNGLGKSAYSAARETVGSRAVASVQVAGSTSAIETVDGRAIASVQVAGSTSAIETVDGRAIASVQVAGSTSAIETVDGRAIAAVQVAGNVAMIETVDGRAMMPVTANVENCRVGGAKAA